ncbi:MAG: alkylhydroperoxidase [Phycisphaeraceae bacterium]|nr:MAG: alkylhydroperoxidase [Phycisphaeraceae bacterium]
MAYIRVIPPEQADADLAERYRRVADADGAVDHVLQIHSLNPESLDAHMAMYVQAMRRRSPLSRAEREIAGVVASVEAGCEYCIVHHTQGLRSLLPDDRKPIADQIRCGEWSGLTTRERAIANYARKLAAEPAAIGPEDIETLRETGLDDREILDLAQAAAYFAYANRIVLGLGVELEPGRIEKSDG